MLENFIIFIHIIICLYLSLYAIIIKNTKYDYIYIIFLYFTILHWLFLKGECIFSYLYKKIKNNNYKLGSNFKYDEFYYLFGKYKKLILNIKNILVLLNVYILYKRNKNYRYMIIILIFIILFVKYKYQHTN